MNTLLEVIKTSNLLSLEDFKFFLVNAPLPEFSIETVEQSCFYAKNERWLLLCYQIQVLKVTEISTLLRNLRSDRIRSSISSSIPSVLVD